MRLVIFAALAAGFSGCNLQRSGQTPGSGTEPLTLGTALLEPSALVFIAEERGLFARNGLRVSTRYYETGLGALDGMLGGEVDVSVPVSDYVLVGKAFGREAVQAIGSIARVDFAVIVGRKDHGIQAVSDLRGKRIGVVRGTVLEFFLGRHLELRGISGKEMELVDGGLPQAVSALTRGEIDAAITVPPYLHTLQGALGDNAVLWPAQDSHAVHQLLIGGREWIRRYPGRVSRLLRALSEAEGYLVRHPERAKAVVKKKMGLSDEEAARVWARNEFSLTLDQSLLTAMEEEARWMIENGLTAEAKVPDFLQYLYPDGLLAIRPEAVNIVR